MEDLKTEVERSWKRWSGKLRRFARLAALALSLPLAALPAFADSDPTNDSDNITIQLVPVVDFGVLVDTSGSAWIGSGDLDATMNLGAENTLSAGVKVTVVGNFNLQELQLQGTALDNWTLDTDEVDQADQFRLYGLFAADGAAAPASGDFNGASHLIRGDIAKLAGQPQANEGGDSNHTFELSTGHASYANVDNMQVNSIRRLWLRANTPSFSGVATQQRFTVTVTAVSGAAQ